jgi:triosephosphate isomerase
MLADLGCTYVEVGHHERRRDHGETDQLIAAKVAAAQRWGMTAILCIGETERSPLDEVTGILDGQLRRAMALDLHRLVIAYEPAWAIGVGARAAPPRWVGQVHAAIRGRLASTTSDADTVPILYGGSVSPAAAGSLLGQPDVDGLFVGRQALDPLVFAAIAHTPVQRESVST